MHPAAHRSAVAWLFCLAGCTAPPLQQPPTVTADPLEGWPANAATGAPLLGSAFGELRTLEAITVLRTQSTKGGPPEIVDAELEVLRIDGQSLSPRMMMPWTYASMYAEQERTASDHGFLLQPGCRYLLRGYEAGCWCGLAPAAREFDGFGPPQTRNHTFYFRSVFRVLDATLLEPDAGPARRPR